MPNYVARVELHKGTLDDYEKLHAELQQRGFVRTIIGEDRLTYRLPTGTYLLDSNALLPEAISQAQAAATATGKTSSILVAERTQMRIAGLERLK